MWKLGGLNERSRLFPRQVVLFALRGGRAFDMRRLAKKSFLDGPIQHHAKVA
jgi:hypothetical protein